MFLSTYISKTPITDFGLGYNSIKFSATLAAATNTGLTVPGDTPRYKALMIIPAGASVWFAVNAAATVPAGASFLSTNSEMLQTVTTCREVKAGDVLNFINTTGGVDVSVILYAFI